MFRFAKFTMILLLILATVVYPVAFPGHAIISSAASYNDLNDESVFLKQQTSVTCTLSSMAMLMRRTAIAAGSSDWEEITEYSIRPTAWIEGMGLRWSFTCYDMTAGHDYFTKSNQKAEMLSLLNKYPQGVVIYNSGNAGQYHAILLCDYNEKEDMFYVADPANNMTKGRIPITDSSIRGETQEEQIANLSAYWYISTPRVIVSGSASSGSTAKPENNNTLPAYYITTASVLNVRRTPVTGVIIGKLLQGARVQVLAIEDGWAKIRHNGETGWISVEYIEKEDGALAINSIVTDADFVIKDKQLECSVTASGGSGDYSYCFSVFKNDEVFFKGSFDSASSLTYTFTTVGTYIITCTVKDSAGDSVTEKTSKILVVNSGDGDVNFDGTVTAGDARMVLRHSARLENLSDKALKRADMNHDGDVNASDARSVLNYSAAFEK